MSERADHTTVQAALEQLSDFESAQFGDVLWMTSSMRDAGIDAALCAPWLAEIEVLEARITSHLHALGTACGTNNETKINAALDAQSDMWSEINVLVARLVQTFPVLLDSDWQPLPMPVKELKAARDTKDFQENDT